MKHITLSLIVISAVALLQLDLAGQEEQPLADRVKQLERFSKVERDRFDRNVEEFRTLSPEQMARVRQLHEDLIKDHQQGGTMMQVLDMYTQWLQTLSPTQRDQLQNEPETGRKIALVRQFMEEGLRRQKEEHERLAKEEHDTPPSSVDTTGQESILNFRQRNPVKSLGLNPKELESVMQVIYDDLPREKKTGELQSLSVRQYISVISESVKLKNAAEWPNEDLLKKMTGTLPKWKEQTVKTIAQSGVMPERDLMVRMLLGSTMRQMRDLMPRPTDEDRATTLESLKPQERKNYDKQPESKQTDFLNRKFLEKKGDDSFLRFQDCKKTILDLFQQVGVAPDQGFQRQFQNREAGQQPKS